MFIIQFKVEISSKIFLIYIKSQSITINGNELTRHRILIMINTSSYDAIKFIIKNMPPFEIGAGVPILISSIIIEIEIIPA